MNFQTMSRQRKFILIAAAAGVLSMFLPWVSISLFGYTQTVNGMHDIGILVFLCFVAAAVIACLGDQTKNLDRNLWGIVLVAGAIALLSIIYFYFRMSGQVMGSSFVGFGLYIAAIAAITILGSAYILRSPTDNLKDSFNRIRSDIGSRMDSTNKPPVDPGPPVGDETNNNNTNR